MIASFALLKPEELALMPADLTVMVFPVGGLESHGAHLPLGVKIIHAEELSKQICAKLEARLKHWNFILMPTLALTVDTVTSKTALPVRAHVVRDALVDQCEHLKRLGFRNFAAVSAHTTPKQLTAIEDAGKIVSRKFPNFGNRASLISVTSALVESNEAWASPWIGIPKEHGGAFDVSLMMKWAPSTPGVLKSGDALLSRPKASPSRFIAYFNHEIDQTWGAQENVGSDFALKELDERASELSERMIPWLERGEGRAQFLSAYRYFPVNGSFFKVYMLATVFFVMMLMWALWSMRDVFEFK